VKKSQKKELLERFELKYIQKTWVEHGLYRAGEILNCNPFIVYHLAREYKWRRELPLFLEKAYREGSWRLSERYYIENKGKNDGK
jgi:hypothetical protein